MTGEHEGCCPWLGLRELAVIPPSSAFSVAHVGPAGDSLESRAKGHLLPSLKTLQTQSWWLTVSGSCPTMSGHQPVGLGGLAEVRSS